MADAPQPDNWTNRIQQVRLLVHEVAIVLSLVAGLYGTMSAASNASHEQAFEAAQKRWNKFFATQDEAAKPAMATAPAQGDGK